MANISEADKNTIINMYLDDARVLEIVTRTGVNKWSVYYIIKKLKRERFFFKKRVEVIRFKKVKTEIRPCSCDIQDCKGHFLIKSDKHFTICPHEAMRRKLINNIKEYYS